MVTFGLVEASNPILLVPFRHLLVAANVSGCSLVDGHFSRLRKSI